MLLVLILRRVNSGFMEQYSALKTHALTFVKESLAKIKIDEIIVTGHSLGGAVAAMLAFLEKSGLTFILGLPYAAVWVSPRYASRTFG